MAGETSEVLKISLISEEPLWTYPISLGFVVAGILPPALVWAFEAFLAAGFLWKSLIHESHLWLNFGWLATISCADAFFAIALIVGPSLTLANRIRHDPVRYGGFLAGGAAIISVGESCLLRTLGSLASQSRPYLGAPPGGLDAIAHEPGGAI